MLKITDLITGEDATDDIAITTVLYQTCKTCLFAKACGVKPCERIEALADDLLYKIEVVE